MREVHQNLEVGWTNLSREIELTESVEKSGVREQERLMYAIRNWLKAQKALVVQFQHPG